MPTKTTIDFDDLILEADVHVLIDKCTEVMEHIHANIPNEMIFINGGEPNVRTRWGAVYFHAGMARSSLRAFL